MQYEEVGSRFARLGGDEREHHGRVAQQDEDEQHAQNRDGLRLPAHGQTRSENRDDGGQRTEVMAVREQRR